MTMMNQKTRDLYLRNHYFHLGMILIAIWVLFIITGYVSLPSWRDTDFLNAIKDFQTALRISMVVPLVGVIFTFYAWYQARKETTE